jgi:hypothetical protein
MYRTAVKLNHCHTGTGDLIHVLQCCWLEFNSRIYGLMVDCYDAWPAGPHVCCDEQSVMVNAFQTVINAGEW